MDLKLVSEFTESKMYRTKHAVKNVTAREVADMVFMDMIALWIFYQDYEFAPFSREYARKTIMYGRFDKFYSMATDLYINLHLLFEKRTDYLETVADKTLLDRITIDVQTVKKYLQSLSANQLHDGMARITLQKLERSLHIEDSNYRSIRRLAQDWLNLTTQQRKLVVTRMLLFYKTHAKKSEIYQVLKAFAASENLYEPNAKNPEKPSAVKTAAAAAAAATVGYIAGYNFGKSLV